MIAYKTEHLNNGVTIVTIDSGDRRYYVDIMPNGGAQVALRAFRGGKPYMRAMRPSKTTETLIKWAKQSVLEGVAAAAEPMLRAEAKYTKDEVRAIEMDAFNDGIEAGRRIALHVARCNTDEGDKRTVQLADLNIRFDVARRRT